MLKNLIKSDLRGQRHIQLHNAPSGTKILTFVCQSKLYVLYAFNRKAWEFSLSLSWSLMLLQCYVIDFIN